MTTPDNAWIEKAAKFVASKLDYGLTEAAIVAFARELQSAFEQGVAQERERLTKQATLEVNKVLVAVSEASIDAETMALAERNRIRRADVAQLGWFACWRSFVALLDGIPAALTPPPSEGERS